LADEFQLNFQASQQRLAFFLLLQAQKYLLRLLAFPRSNQAVEGFVSPVYRDDFPSSTIQNSGLGIIPAFAHTL
jgi:hypothetical protein